MITILGPTATGKTNLAAHVADALNGEIISADSRQVYRGMNIGTGKDYEDYIVEGKLVPHHLVDIVEPGYKYNVYEFQKDFFSIYEEILKRKKAPVLCGGTGMYLEAALSGYRLLDVPTNKKLRNELSAKTLEELNTILSSFKTMHNISDSLDKDRTIRAIEIQEYYRNHPKQLKNIPVIKSDIFGIKFDRAEIRRRITQRLEARFKEGMVEEVGKLLRKGLKPEQLKFYGLEYKFVTQFVTGEISYDDMFRLLNTAIHQFAKRQMTWFRKMEKKGFEINWIDGNLPLSQKMEIVLGKAKAEA